MKLPLCGSLVPQSMAWKQDAFQHNWNDLSAYVFSPFTLLRKIMSRVLLSTNLSLALVTPLWPQEECFADLLALLVEEPFELPLLWNHLVQPHIRKFHWGLEILWCQAWNLLSDLSAKLTFQERLRRLSHRTSGDAQRASTKENSLDSSTEISLYARPQFCKYLSFCVCGGSWSHQFLLLRDTELPLNHVLSLGGKDMAASSIISGMFNSFKTCPPREVKLPEWNLSLLPRSLTCSLHEPLKLSLDK